MSTVKPALRTEIHLLATLDNYLTHRRDPVRRLVGPGHHEREAIETGTREIQLGDSRRPMVSLIISDGESIGFWAWNSDEARLVWGSLDPIESDVREAIEAKGELTVAFIREQFDGVARANSTDGA